MVFVSIILLLIVVDLGPITCPACGGRGYIDLGEAYGMDKLRIVSVKTKIVEVFIVEYCGGPWHGYIIATNITMVNDGSVTTHGYIEATFKDSETGKVLDKKALLVQISAGMTGYAIAQPAYFVRNLALPGVNVSVELPSDVTCPMCEGKGKTNILRSYLLVSAVSRLTETANITGQ